jgi:hypothetical protein
LDWSFKNYLKQLKFKKSVPIVVLMNQTTKVKVNLPTKEQIEENYGYSIHEACTRLNLGINELKELCRSYDIPRWPKVRKVREKSDSFQSFSINKSFKSQPENTTKVNNRNIQVINQTKTVKPLIKNQITVEPKQQENNVTQEQTENNQKDKMSIFNLCN